MSVRGSEQERMRVRKTRAMLILLGLVFLAIVLLLVLHSAIVGRGSLFYDTVTNALALISSLALLSGVAFPAMAFVFLLLIVPALFIFYLFGSKKNDKP